MSEKKYHVKQKKNISFFEKYKLKKKAAKINKEKINSLKSAEKENKARAAEIERIALKKAKESKREAEKIRKENEAENRAKEKEKAERDRRILKEAELHQKELKKALKAEDKKERKEEKQKIYDEKQRLKQLEKIRKNQRLLINTEKSSKERKRLSKEQERRDFIRSSRNDSKIAMRKKEEEYRLFVKNIEDAKKAEKAIEEAKRKASGITKMDVLIEKIKTFMSYYSYQNLRETINSYGYSYSFMEFILQSVAIIGVIIAVSVISQLNATAIIIITIMAIVTIPFLLYAYFKQLYSMKRFEMVQSYLSNIVPVFIQKPKYRYAAEEVEEMSEMQMQESIKHAVAYIDTNNDDTEVVATAMNIIETEFPNSRIHAVHKLMQDIENGNSETYVDICENMYIDIEGWIRRVYNFQKELKSKRTSLLMLCILSVILNTVFVYMYGTSEIFEGFTDSTLYQISTAFFIIAIFIISALIVTLLHGGWLVDDNRQKDENEKIRSYTYIHTHDDSIKTKDVVMAFMFGIAGLVVVFGMNNNAGFGIFILAVMVLFHSKTTFNSHKRKVARALTIEFPV